MINTVKALAKYKNPATTICMHQQLYARNQNVQYHANLEWNELVKSQTDTVKIHYSVKSMKLIDHKLHVLRSFEKTDIG